MNALLSLVGIHGRIKKNMKRDKQPVPVVEKSRPEELFQEDLVLNLKDPDSTVQITVDPMCADDFMEMMDRAHADINEYILVRGLPGTGKTTLANKLSQVFQCYPISMDKFKSIVSMADEATKKMYDDRVVVLEGIFHKADDVQKLFNEICSRLNKYAQVKMIVVEPAYLAYKSPEKCWYNTLKRDGPNTSLAAIHKLHEEWEPVGAKFYRYKPGSSEMPGL